MKNKVLILSMSVLLMISLSACKKETSTTVSKETTQNSSEKVNVEENNSEKTDVTDVKEEKSETKVEKEVKDQDKKETKTVTVYYSDDQAENLIEKQIKIELIAGESLEKQILGSLKIKPTDPKLYNVIGENIKIKSVRIEGKLAKVDLSGQGLNGSSTEETLLKDSVILALTNLDTVERVQFLVDGKPAETLMGQVGTLEPFTRDDVETKVIKGK